MARAPRRYPCARASRHAPCFTSVERTRRPITTRGLRSYRQANELAHHTQELSPAGHRASLPRFRCLSHTDDRRTARIEERRISSTPLKTRKCPAYVQQSSWSATHNLCAPIVLHTAGPGVFVNKARVLHCATTECGIQAGNRNPGLHLCPGEDALGAGRMLNLAAVDHASVRLPVSVVMVTRAPGRRAPDGRVRGPGTRIAANGSGMPAVSLVSTDAVRLQIPSSQVSAA